MVEKMCKNAVCARGKQRPIADEYISGLRTVRPAPAQVSLALDDAVEPLKELRRTVERELLRLQVKLC